MQQITKLYCETCKKGIVKLIVKKLKSGDIDIRVTNCSVCKRSYGIKGIQDLKQVME